MQSLTLTPRLLYQMYPEPIVRMWSASQVLLSPSVDDHNNDPTHGIMVPCIVTPHLSHPRSMYALKCSVYSGILRLTCVIIYTLNSYWYCCSGTITRPSATGPLSAMKIVDEDR